MSGPAALITGGTSGIGKATAELLHRRGYQVIVTGQNPETIAAAEKSLPEQIVVVRADARSLADTDRLVAEIRDRLGVLDVLFLNAGVTRSRPIEAVNEATFDELFSVNVKGQFFILQKALPLLNDGGSIIFTVGIGATRGVSRRVRHRRLQGSSAGHGAIPRPGTGPAPDPGQRRQPQAGEHPHLGQSRARAGGGRSRHGLPCPARQDRDAARTSRKSWRSSPRTRPASSPGRTSSSAAEPGSARSPGSAHR